MWLNQQKAGTHPRLSLPKRPPVGLVLPMEETTGASEPPSSCRGSLPTLVCPVEPRFISQIHLLLLPTWWRDTSGRGTAKGSSRQDVPTGTAGTEVGHPSLASHVLCLRQTKTHFLRLPSTFTVILTSTSVRHWHPDHFLCGGSSWDYIQGSIWLSAAWGNL